MKTIKRIGFMAFAALTLAVTSCSSDDSSGGTGSSLDNYVNGKVDGTLFETFSMNGFSAGTSVKNGTMVTITGTAMESVGSTNVKTMTILLMDVTGTGTYQIGPDSDSVLSYFDSAASISWDTSNCSGATGTVTVTTFNDQKIEGTFNFTGKDDDNCSSQKVVTEGSFRGTFSSEG